MEASKWQTPKQQPLPFVLLVFFPFYQAAASFLWRVFCCGLLNNVNRRDIYICDGWFVDRTMNDVEQHVGKSELQIPETTQIHDENTMHTAMAQHGRTDIEFFLCWFSKINKQTNKKVNKYQYMNKIRRKALTPLGGTLLVNIQICQTKKNAPRSSDEQQATDGMHDSTNWRLLRIYDHQKIKYTQKFLCVYVSKKEFIS